MTNPGFSKLSIVGKVESNLHGFLGGLFYYDKYIIFLVCFLFIVNIFYIKNKQIIIESLAWIVSGSLQILVLLLSPGGAIEDRTHFGAFVFMTIAAVKMFNIPKVTKKVKKIYMILIYVIGIFTLCGLVYGSIDSYKTNVALNMRNSYILSQKSLGKKTVYVKPLSHHGESRYSITHDQGDYKSDPNFWINKCTEHNLRVKRIILKNK